MAGCSAGPPLLPHWRLRRTSLPSRCVLNAKFGSSVCSTLHTACL